MFRSIGKSKIAFALAILFGLSLFFFRGGERYSNLFNSDNIVASVSGTPISTTKFLRIMQMNINQYSQMFGKPLNSEEIQAFQIHSMALGQLINNAVFENEFDSNNYIIDETVVASETKKRFPNLYDENNKLNENNLNSFLSNQNLKIEDVVKIIDYESRSLIFDKLFFDVDYPEQMEVVLNKYNNHTRNIDLIKFNINNFKLPNFNDLNISINNNLIKDFFDKNINSYINPEKRNISYIVIDKKDFKDQFKPSSSQIQNYYNKNENLFLVPEKRNFVQFNFKDIKEASKFRMDIDSLNSEKIIEYANKNNIKFNKFLKVSSSEVLKNLSNVIFDLKINQVSDIVETPLAKHIIIVSQVYPEIQKSLDQSTEEISSTLLEVETDNYVLDLKNKINQQILDGFSLNEIASDNFLNIKTLKNVKRKFNETENDLIKSNVIEMGFGTNKDFVSNMTDVDDNRSIVINVDKIENEKPYELNEVFDTVSSDWIKSLKIKSIEKKIQEVSDTTNSIQDMSSFVKSDISNNDIRLNDVNYPSTLKNIVFTNEINKITLSVVGDEIYISALNKISFPNEQEKVQVISLLSELRSNFGAEVIKNKNISTNDNLIQALISQY